MERRAFIGILGGALLAGANVADAQQSGKPWRVGFLGGGVRPPNGAVPAPLREQLQSLGYTEGKDIVYEGLWAGGRIERLHDLAVELSSRKPDVIVTLGGPGSEAAKQASSTIPIVALSAGDMLETGLVTSLARPGGNVTGINDPAAVLSAKRLEILKELVPNAKRVAVLWNAGNYAMTLRYREVERAAQVLGMSVDALGVREPEDFEGALSAMTRTRPDTLMMLTDALTNLNRQPVLDYVSAQRIPAMYEFGYVVQAGGLISYGSDDAETFRLAAGYVARILKGARPGDLPIEQPNRYLLIINVKTAGNLGLAVPQSLLVRADQIVQ